LPRPVLNARSHRSACPAPFLHVPAYVRMSPAASPSWYSITSRPHSQATACGIHGRKPISLRISLRSIRDAHKGSGWESRNTLRNKEGTDSGVAKAFSVASFRARLRYLALLSPLMFISKIGAPASLFGTGLSCAFFYVLLPDVSTPSILMFPAYFLQAPKPRRDNLLLPILTRFFIPCGPCASSDASHWIESGNSPGALPWDISTGES